MKFVLSCLAISLLLGAMPVSASPGSPTPIEFQALLSMDYKAFDQTLPDGGWRAIVDPVEAGKVLDAYHLNNFEKLEVYQHRIIYWHAGQSYALGDLYELAVARFGASFNRDEKPNDEFKWNFYVRASIAFLQKDMKALVSARDELAQATHSGAKVNLKIVNAFIRCFNKPYRLAYNSDCQ